MPSVTEGRRVHEVARLHGVTSHQVLRVLPASAGDRPRTASSRLSPEEVGLVSSALSSHADAAVAQGGGRDETGAGSGNESSTGQMAASDTLAPPESNGDLGALRALIRQAYDAARASGKVDWDIMSTAVLKNRISQLQGRKFDQRSYGYARMLDLVLDFPEMLVVDLGVNPPVAKLADQPTTSSTRQAEVRSTGEAVRVRHDLWQAVMDYDAGQSYVLVEGRAVLESEVPVDAVASPPLPTLTTDELSAWREDFTRSAERIIAGHPESQERLRRWVEGRKGTRALPSILQSRWNAYLSAAVLDRLQDWFAKQGVPAPADMALARERLRRPELAQQVNEENALRRALIECLGKMTYDELRQVMLPATSLLRMRA